MTDSVTVHSLASEKKKKKKKKKNEENVYLFPTAWTTTCCRTEVPYR